MKHILLSEHLFEENNYIETIEVQKKKLEFNCTVSHVETLSIKKFA